MCIVNDTQHKKNPKLFKFSETVGKYKLVHLSRKRGNNENFLENVYNRNGQQNRPGNL